MRLGLFSFRKIIRRRNHIDFAAVRKSSQKLKTVEAAINGDASCRAAVVIFDGDDVHGSGFIVRTYSSGDGVTELSRLRIAVKRITQGTAGVVLLRGLRR